MKTIITLLGLILTGCSGIADRHDTAASACWSPVNRRATADDSARFRMIVSSLQSNVVAMREITGYAEPPDISREVSPDSKAPLPLLPLEPQFRVYDISNDTTQAIFQALRQARPLLPGEGAGREREVYLYLGDELPYGEMLVLQLMAGDVVLAELVDRTDFPEDAEVFLCIPGLDQITKPVLEMKTGAEQSGPAYPPQGVGSADP